MSECEDIEMHYCKFDAKNGKPIHITNTITRKVIKTDYWKFKGYDKDKNPIEFEMKFNNTTGAAKASGAKVVLKLRYVKMNHKISKFKFFGLKQIT